MANSSSAFTTTATQMMVENITEHGGIESTTHPPMVELPFGIEAVAPIILLEFVTVVVCNLILMALVIKARKVNNNTNIYLFSLSVCGLLESINLLSLTVAVFARKWVFGRELCYINDFILRLTYFPVLLTHALVSRDRYKAIKDPLNYWKVSTKRTYILNAFVWIVSGILALSSVIWFIIRTPLPKGPLTGLECFLGLDLLQGGFTVSLIEIISILVFNKVWMVFLSVFTVWHYFLVLRELHMLTKLRSQFRVLSNSSILKVNGRDKPLHCTAEERAAKSLALMFLLEFVCSLTSLSIILILSILMLTSKYESHKNAFTVVIILSLCTYMLPGINPVVLALSNKRFRKRVKGLLKCELKPELEESHDYGHLNETDEMQLPSTGLTGFSKRQSIIFTRKTNVEPTNNQQCTLDSGVDEDELATNEEISAAHLKKRNISVATIAAVDVTIEVHTNMCCNDKRSPSDILNTWKDINDQ